VKYPNTSKMASAFANCGESFEFQRLTFPSAPIVAMF